MESSRIDTNKLAEFSRIHSSILPKRNKSFNKKGFVISKFQRSPQEQKLFEPILEKTTEILDSYNKNYDESECYIEFQQRNCGFEEKHKRTFDWHSDNYGAVSYKVYSIIYYLRKDGSIRGGNLEYKKDGKTVVQSIEGGQIVWFDGGLKHRPEICSGFGCRDLIVVFVKKIN